MARWNQVVDPEAPEGHSRRFSVEVVAVRWMCESCWRTAVGRPGALPDGWVEVPKPPWLAASSPGFACPEHASDLLARADRQWSLYTARRFEVDAAEFEALRARIDSVARDLGRVMLSGRRVGNP